MNIEDFCNYCLTKTGAKETMPFGPDNIVFKVGTKMFALAALDEVPSAVNLKCDPDRALELRDRYEQERANVIRTVVSRVDQRDAVPEELGHRCSQKWVMRAAENQGVDPSFYQWVKILEDHLIGDGVLKPPFFDQWNKEGACSCRYL